MTHHAVARLLRGRPQRWSRRRLQGAVVALLVVLVVHARATHAAAPDERLIAQRASEGGAWWMLVQTACEPATTQKTMSAINAMLVAIGASSLQPLVVERIEDPHLDEKSRLAMEAVMTRAAAVRLQAEEMAEVKAALAAGRKPGAGLQRKSWTVSRPIRTGADLDLALKQTQAQLAALCREGVDGVTALLLDPTNGVGRDLR